MGDGAEYGEEEAGEAAHFVLNMEIERMLEAYSVVKRAHLQTQVSCPVCGKTFLKINFRHAFCSNGRTRKGGNCKDRFWNLTDPVRRERAAKFI